MIGQVIKSVASRITVLSEGKKYICSLRGRIKQGDNIFVGDVVEFSLDKESKGIIENIRPRKNLLERPYIANIDKLIIVVATVPQTEWEIVEKLIVNCYMEGIEPIICLNKCDMLDEKEIDRIISTYEKDMKCFAISAKTGKNIEELAHYIDGSLVCFAGHSAVGKTSIINALAGYTLKTGELNSKGVGKTTTRHIEIFPLASGFIADTCGFDILDIPIKKEELCYYYDSFIAFADKCHYRGCTHTVEPDCAVREAVEKGLINKVRYMRYLHLYKVL